MLVAASRAVEVSPVDTVTLRALEVIEVVDAEDVVRKNATGVTVWKKPQQQPELIKSIQEMRRKMPGPGDYDHLVT